LGNANTITHFDRIGIDSQSKIACRFENETKAKVGGFFRLQIFRSIVARNRVIDLIGSSLNLISRDEVGGQDFYIALSWRWRMETGPDSAADRKRIGQFI